MLISQSVPVECSLSNFLISSVDCRIRQHVSQLAVRTSNIVWNNIHWELWQHGRNIEPKIPYKPRQGKVYHCYPFVPKLTLSLRNYNELATVQTTLHGASYCRYYKYYANAIEKNKRFLTGSNLEPGAQRRVNAWDSNFFRARGMKAIIY